MQRLKMSWVWLIAMVVTASLDLGCASTTTEESESLTITEMKGGRGMTVTMSEPLARSLLEDTIGSGLTCGADLDTDVASMLRNLDRGGRGSRASLRDDDSVITVWRSGKSLKMEIRDADDGGWVELTMPWAVAECLLDGSAKLSAKDAGSIRIKLVGEDGGGFEFAVN